MIDTPDLKGKYTIIDMPRLEGTVTEIEIFCLHHGKQTIKTNIPYEEFNFLHIVCSKCQVEAGAVPDVEADVCQCENKRPPINIGPIVFGCPECRKPCKKFSEN